MKGYRLMIIEHFMFCLELGFKSVGADFLDSHGGVNWQHPDD